MHILITDSIGSIRVVKWDGEKREPMMLHPKLPDEHTVSLTPHFGEIAFYIKLAI